VNRQVLYVVNDKHMAYPLDDEGFACVSTDLKSDLERYNMGVVQILDEKEREASIAALWQEMGPKVTADPATWETENWPDPKHVFLTNRYAVSEQAFRNRLHPRLIQAFAQLYDTEDLWTTIDFWGVKRATVFGDHSRPDWRTNPLALHWDTDIERYAKEREHGRKRYQAILALNDNDQQVGSLVCVPGSANELLDWTKTYKAKDGKYVPRGNPLHKRTQRIPLRASHCVIWDVGTAHANYSNYSNSPRLTQYVRMVPRTHWAKRDEPQTIVHYWKACPEVKKDVLEMGWTEAEQRLLGLKL
jgi:hypothetical protein